RRFTQTPHESQFQIHEATSFYTDILPFRVTLSPQETQMQTYPFQKAGFPHQEKQPSLLKTKKIWLILGLSEASVPPNSSLAVAPFTKLEFGDTFSRKFRHPTRNCTPLLSSLRAVGGAQLLIFSNQIES
ncbi:MAG: hypothetical protein AAB316_14365, partial [Bacteroidota bacterium]